MVRLTVNLTPPLTGVIGEIWYQAAGNWYKAIDTPASVDGVIDFSYSDSIPDYPHKIVFPEQTIGGVTYLQAETSVFDLLSGDQTFYVTLTPAAVGIHTTTTISIPDEVGVGEKFYISGILYETESGIAIPNQPINHSYNGKNLGSSTTGIDGDYLKEVSIPEAGVWTLKSEFPGTETLQASKSQANAVVAATPLEMAIAIIGSAATGLAMTLYCLR